MMFASAHTNTFVLEVRRPSPLDTPLDAIYSHDYHLASRCGLRSLRSSGA